MQQENNPHLVKSQFEESSVSEEHKDGDLFSIQSIKDGHWTETEIFRFIAFLIFNRDTLKLKLQRRTNKVFKQMSEFVGSRTSVQCRSQNQRLFRKFKNFRSIISAFKNDYGRDRFDSDYKQACKMEGIKFKTELQTLVENHRAKETAEQGTQTDAPLIPTVIQRQPYFFEQGELGQHAWSQNMLFFPFYS